MDELSLVVGPGRASSSGRSTSVLVNPTRYRARAAPYQHALLEHICRMSILTAAALFCAFPFDWVE